MSSLTAKGHVLVRVSVLLFFITVNVNAVGQSLIPAGGSEDPFKVNITPPAPEAAALAKYAEIPVSLYSGTPNITIPLYEVKERGGLSLPISLSYHSSGFKVTEQASRVGLGWALNAGGVVTRSMRGWPDEYPTKGFYAQSFQHDVSDYALGTIPGDDQAQLYWQAADGCVDVEPDVFYFNFAGYSGKMMFNWDGQLEIESSASLIVTPIGLSDHSGGSITAWKITAEDGTIYLFESIETTQSLPAFPQLSCSLALQSAIPSAWYLTGILTPDNPAASWIKLEYESYSQNYDTWSMETQTHNQYLSPSIPQRQINTNYIGGKQLKRIVTSSGETTIEFLKGAQRTDIAGNSYTLGEILVKNSAGKIVSDFQFGYDYSTNRLTLRTITEKAGAATKPPYSFNYNPGSLPLPTSFAQDHWGFPNGNGAQTLIPATRTTRYNDPNPVPLAGADRSPSPDRLLNCMLREIIYPTGGRDVFVFEPHDYSFHQSQELTIPVLKTPQIIHETAPDEGTAEGQVDTDVKVFTISRPSTISLTSVIRQIHGGFGGSTFLTTVQLVKVSNGAVIFEHDLDGTRQATFTDQTGEFKLIVSVKKPFSEIGFADAAVDVYIQEETNEVTTEIKKGGGVRIKSIRRSFGNGNPDKVTNYVYRLIEDGREKSSGSLLESAFVYENWMVYFTAEGQGEFSGIPGYDIEHKFVRYAQNRAVLGTTQGGHVGYSVVTVLEGGNNIYGKTISTYSSPRSVSDYSNLEIPYPPATSFEYKRGLLLKEEFFNSDNIIVRSIENEYGSVSRIVPAWKIGYLRPGAGPIGALYLDRFAVSSYDNIIGYTRLKTTREKNYFLDVVPSQSIVETGQRFVYNEDPLHKQLVMTATADSENDSIYTRIIYPQDYASGGVMEELRTRHIVNLPIEKITWKQRIDQKYLLSAVKTDFKNFPEAKRALPSVVYGAKLSNPLVTNDPIQTAQGLYEPRLEYLKYDQYSNVIEHAVKDGQVTGYIWGANGTQLIAKVDNVVNYQTYYYTSFEEETTNISQTEWKTGKKSKVLNGTPFSVFLNVPAGRGYILSYWVKEGSGKWTYKEKQLAYHQGGNYTISTEPINGYLDEFRFYPLGSIMTTFNFEPLVGISSITDANNISGFFEYDAFNRLKTKRDDDGNIVETYQYHFQKDIKNDLGYPPPVISDVNPRSGFVGDLVTIKGANFGMVWAENVVTFNGVPASILNATETELLVQVPSVSTGKITVQVHEKEISTAFKFIVAPHIASFLPASGVPSSSSGLPGSVITLYGHGFSNITSENKVKFNGTEAVIDPASTSTNLSVIVPQGASTGKISIEVAGGASVESLTDFIVLQRNTWSQVADFANGLLRTSAVGFSIGKKIYMGTGQDQNNQYTNDFWEYDTETNIWTRKADFPGVARTDAVGFTIGSKGYVGLGWNGTQRLDFWEYDPITNTWKQVANFKGPWRGSPISFVIGSKAYVGTGAVSSTNLSDLWEYDAVVNDWVQRANMPIARNGAFAFSISGEGYVGAGGPLKDFWKYSPSSNQWVKLADLPSSIPGPSSFVIGNNGYVQSTNLFWVYNSSTGTWIAKGPLSFSLTFSKAFSVNGLVFLGTGLNATYTKVKSFYKYIPE